VNVTQTEASDELIIPLENPVEKPNGKISKQLSLALCLSSPTAEFLDRDVKATSRLMQFHRKP
jgi:hypothetical protein